MAETARSRTRVAFIKEVTENVIPTTPAMKALRCKGETFEPFREFDFEGEMDARRGEKNYALIGSEGRGGFIFDFTRSTLDDILEGVMRSAWATNTLTDGDTPVTFYFETTFETGTTDIYKRLWGAQINKLQLTVENKKRVTGSIEVLSRSAAYSATPVTGATYVAANTNPIVTAATVNNMTMAGLALDCVQSIDFTIDNGLTAQYCLGSLEPTGINSGKLKVDGKMRVLLDSNQLDLLVAYQDGTPTSLSFGIDTGTSLRTRFTFANIILTKALASAPDLEGVVEVDIEWRAIQNASGVVAQIQRLQ